MAKLLFVLALVACAYAQDYDAIFDTLMNTCGMHTCDNNQLNLSSDECWTCLTEECGTRRQRARFEAEIDQLTDDENGACATVFGCAVGCGVSMIQFIKRIILILLDSVTTTVSLF